MTERFTKEELYEIEKYFDNVAGMMSKTFIKTSEQALYFNAVTDKHCKETAEKLFEQLGKIASAQNIIDSIRKKCEKARKEKEGES